MCADARPVGRFTVMSWRKSLRGGNEGMLGFILGACFFLFEKDECLRNRELAEGTGVNRNRL